MRSLQYCRVGMHCLFRFIPANPVVISYHLNEFGTEFITFSRRDDFLEALLVQVTLVLSLTFTPFEPYASEEGDIRRLKDFGQSLRPDS